MQVFFCICRVVFYSHVLMGGNFVVGSIVDHCFLGLKGVHQQLGTLLSPMGDGV